MHSTAKERTNSVRGKNWQAKGSIAAEAALVVPVVFLAWIAFLYLFQVIQLQETLHYAAAEAVRTATGYGYLIQKAELAGEQAAEWMAASEAGDKSGENEEETAELFKSVKSGIMGEILSGVSAAVFYKGMMADYLDVDWINRSCIRNGYAGIWTNGSDILSDAKCAEVILRYWLEIPFLPGDAFAIPVVQSIRVRSFTGEGEFPEAPDTGKAAETESQVYVTAYGRVYHTNKDCTYIRVDVISQQYQKLSEVRNAAGSRYHPCSYCEQEPVRNCVYITKYGEAYHTTQDCTRIKHEVKSLTLSETEGTYRLCSKCAKEGEN